MQDVLSRNWWAVLLRGLVALALAAVTWARPGLTLAILIVLFGVFALADGIFAIVSAVRTARRQETWWPLVVEGVFGIVIGVAAFTSQKLGAAAVTLLIAGWALCTGALELIAVVRKQRRIKGAWMVALSGVLRVAFGAVLLLRPTAGPHGLALTIAAYASLYGALLVALSLRLKRNQAEEHAVQAPRGGMTPQPA